MIGALVEGRICIAGAGLPVARNALTIAVRWGEQRRQFGTGLGRHTPLMDYLAHQRRLLPVVCAWWPSSSRGSAVATRAASQRTASPRYGQTPTFIVTFEGDNTALMQLLATTLLADVASPFEDLDVVGTVRAITTQRAGRVLSDLTRSLRGEPDLLDPAWQGEVLPLREERLVDALARRLRTLVKEGDRKSVV